MLRLVQAYRVRRISSCPAVVQSRRRFHSDGVQNDKKTIDFDLLFSSCTNLHLAKSLHALLVVSGKARGTVMATRLINKYANLGEVSLSRKTFYQMENRNLYTWNSMVSGFVLNAHFHEALDCFHQLVFNSGLRPDYYTFPPVLKACRNALDGKKVHCSVLKLGFQYDVFVCSSLIHMYSRFGVLDIAHKLLSDMPIRDTGAYNAMISGYCQNGRSSEAMYIFYEMRLEGVEMNSRTVASLLPACAQSGDVLNGMLIHLHAIKLGLLSHLFVSNGLLNMYAKFGNLGDARSVFDQMEEKDVVSWNSMIAAYEQNDDPITALSFFNQMNLTGVKPDLFTLTSLVSVFTRLSDYRQCRSVHAFIIKRDWFSYDIVLGNALIDMYAKLGLIDSAVSVFQQLPAKDVVSYNTMITSYAQNGLFKKAIEAYCQMQRQTDLIPNQGTYVSILPAYTHVGALHLGTKIHGKLTKTRLDTDAKVSTCLIDMYAKCGKLHEATILFNETPRKSLSPWNAIISCYGIHGNAMEALRLFKEMVSEGVQPDGVTFVSLLSACSHSGLVGEGRWCFWVMEEVYGMAPGMSHYGAMVDLLGRAGFLEMALEFIMAMPVRPDGSVWGALLGACRIHGNEELGGFALSRLLEFDPESVAHCVLMANTLADAGKWERAEEVRSLVVGRELEKTPGQSLIEGRSQLVLN